MADENRSVAVKLTYFTVLMVALPIGAFFFFHEFLLIGEQSELYSLVYLFVKCSRTSRKIYAIQ